MRWRLAVLLSSAALAGCTARDPVLPDSTTEKEQRLAGPLAATPIGRFGLETLAPFSGFGNALALDGGTLVAGIEAFHEQAPSQGAVFVFERRTYQFQQTYAVAAGERSGSLLGRHVALKGRWLCSSEQDGDRGNRVVVYERSGSVWTLDGQLEAESLDPGQFAASLGVSGDSIVVGSTLAEGSTSTGSAYVFSRTPAGWDRQVRFIPGASIIPSFGSAVAIEGNTVAVGVYTPTQIGSVWIFERTPAGWTEMARVSPAETGPRDQFGRALAISAGKVYASAPGAFVDSGAVYEFTKSGGQWVETGLILSSRGNVRNEFGVALSAAWPWLLVGAPSDDATGAAYLFSAEFGEWIEEVHIHPPDILTHDNFGRSVGLSGNIAVIGAPGSDAFGNESGAVYPFALGLILGSACTTSAECAGWCVEGLCCDQPCDGACETCRASSGAAVDGACTAAPSGTEAPACLPLLCNGTRLCPENCWTAGCAQGFFCEASNGTCQPTRAPGSSCSENTHCSSGVCEGDTCCDRACSGCNSCNSLLTGLTHGSCAPVLAGTDPRLACAADPGFPESCGADGNCDGNGQCRSYAPATTPCGPTTCLGSTISGKLCNGQGGCGDGQASCAPNQCKDGFCGESCRDDRDCSDDAVCSVAGLCTPKRPIASPCQSGAECGSGFCSDGVCCNVRCAGQCEWCRGENTRGTCTAVVGDPPSGRAACRSSEKPCASVSCDGREREQCTEVVVECGAYCEGDHRLRIPSGETLDCKPYRCNPVGACRTQCTSSLECATGYGCTSRGECLPRGDDGGFGCGCRIVPVLPEPPAAWLLILSVGLALSRNRGRRRDSKPLR